MASDAQIKANRENAQKSTGPNTEDGKNRSCLNAFKHGLAAQDICIEGEDQDLLNMLISELIDEWKPTTRTESMLVERIAHAYLLSKRARFLQAEYRQVACRPTQTHYLMFLPFLHRYHKDHDRSIEKAIEALQNLRKLAREAAKEAPEPTKELVYEDPQTVEPNYLRPKMGSFWNIHSNRTPNLFPDPKIPPAPTTKSPNCAPTSPEYA